MWRLVFIGFLIAHGLVHIAVWAPSYDPEKAPFDPSRSWLLGDARTLAIALAAVSAAVLVVAGLGLLAHAGWWRPVTVAGLAVSTAVIFTPWYLFISAVNLALIVAIAWLSWPTRSMVGA